MLANWEMKPQEVSLQGGTVELMDPGPLYSTC